VTGSTPAIPQGDNAPVDPNIPVYSSTAEAFGAWWVQASDEERQEFANTHADHVRRRR
jgi:hypothetical protein